MVGELQTTISVDCEWHGVSQGNRYTIGEVENTPNRRWRHLCSLYKGSWRGIEYDVRHSSFSTKFIFHVLCELSIDVDATGKERDHSSSQLSIGPTSDPVSHQFGVPQRRPLLQDTSDGWRHFTIDHLAIGNRHARPEALIRYMKMGRIVVVKEHPHRNSQKISNRRHLSLP